MKINSPSIVKIISYLVIAAGLAVIAGWIFDINVLKSLSPGWITMKFTTAVAFVLSGATLYFLAMAKEGEAEMTQVALSITSLVITLLMGSLFFSDVFGIQTGIEDLFIKDAGDIKSVVPGRPSLPTMVNFILIALAAILAIANPTVFLPKLKIIGYIVAAIGATAVIGYIFNVPLLYYYAPGINSAIAVHTAGLFVLLGMGLVWL